MKTWEKATLDELNITATANIQTNENIADEYIVGEDGKSVIGYVKGDRDGSGPVLEIPFKPGV